MVAVGVQDIYLIGNPQITFFKTVYKKYTNFAMESMQQPIEGRPDFGQQIEIPIQRKGDLIKDITIEVLLPILPAGYFWTNGIGNVLIKQADLEIGGQLIDRHYSEWLDIWHQLTTTEGKIGSYNAMCGYYNAISSLRDNAKSNLRLNIPMCFWFNKNYSSILPLIALQFHEVILKIKLRDFHSCYRNESITTLLSSTSYPILNMKVWVDYIHLDMEERRKFAETDHELLIHQLQFNGSEYIARTINNGTIKLSLNHPVKELFWIHINNEYEQQNIKTGNQYLDYSIPNSIETFSEAVLQLNGIDRFEKRISEYFRLVQSYQYHSRYTYKQIYSYSFSLNPENEQPMGSCNMSKFANINLHLDYTTINHSTTDMNLKVYALNYNVLRIMNGMAGLVFSN